MASFFIENFGCRATEADAAALRGGLLAAGLIQKPDYAAVEVVVLNTCTVTAAADAQARDAVRRIHRVNPQARIVVTGCYAQRAPEELVSLGGVASVVGNSHQTEIPSIAVAIASMDSRSASDSAVRDFVPLASLHQRVASPNGGEARIIRGEISARFWKGVESQAAPAHDRTRPILKIQDGCNHRCAYCVIPSVRGLSRSMPPNDVIENVRQMAASGAREIVLSGINLGRYGRDLSPKAGFADIVRRILDETPLEHLRFSSVEPQDITEDFIALAASSARIAPHLHVPLQSGSDRVLRAMHRGYRAAHYGERIQLIRRHIPDAAIGADVIAGFPGESEDDFQHTVSLIERLPFSYLHVFSFSARPGTEGANLPGALPQQTIRERARALRALGARKSDEFRARQAGRTLRALTLARHGDGWTEALTGNYLKVRIAGNHAANQWHDVRVASVPDALIESLASSALSEEPVLAAAG